LRHVVSLGSHDLFIGEIVRAHVNDQVLSENGDVNFTKARPIVYKLRLFKKAAYWSLGKQIGFYGCSLKEK